MKSHSPVAVPQFTAPVEGQVPVNDYIVRCRQRVPSFIDLHFSLGGAFRLNRRACGVDLLIAPFNFLAGIPNFVLAVLAVGLESMGAGGAARWFRRQHLGFSTQVQKALEAELITRLLDLPVQADPCDPLREMARRAAREPVAIYLRTRDIAADVTAGLLAAIAGFAFFSQFTPGSLSAGTAIAQAFVREQAISNFFLGDFLGGWYYDVFPVSPSLSVVLISILIAILALAIVSAFSGMLHDPAQRWMGMHRRRLHGLIDAIEAAMRNPQDTRGYGPKDTFLGRIHDLADWIRGLLNL